MNSVIIKDGDIRVRRVCKDDALGKKLYKMAKAKYEDTPIKVFISTRSNPRRPPKDLKLPPGKLWCPYCNRPRRFKYDDWFGVNKCQICGISDDDFYVKGYNNTWGRDKPKCWNRLDKLHKTSKYKSKDDKKAERKARRMRRKEREG